MKVHIRGAQFSVMVHTGAEQKRSTEVSIGKDLPGICTLEVHGGIQ